MTTPVGSGQGSPTNPARGGPAGPLNGPQRAGPTGGQRARSAVHSTVQAGQRLQDDPDFKAGVRAGMRTARVVQGIGKRIPKTQVQTVWSPDSSSILVVGGSLALANLAVSGSFGGLLKYIWTPVPAGVKSVKSGALFLYELTFIFILYIVGTIYGPATKPILIFLFALWGIFLLFLGPKLVALLPKP